MLRSFSAFAVAPLLLLAPPLKADTPVVNDTTTQYTAQSNYVYPEPICFGTCDLSPSYNHYTVASSFTITKITFNWSNSGSNNCDGYGNYVAAISTNGNSSGVIATSTNSVYLGCASLNGKSGTGELDFTSQSIPASFYLDFYAMDGALQGGSNVVVSDVEIWQAAVVTTGTISVTTNLPAATFTITGPATYSGTGVTFTQIGAPAGTYTITFGTVPGYAAPSSQSQTLSAAGAVGFNGTYQVCLVPKVAIDQTRSDHAISASDAPVSGVACEWILTITNPNSYLWTNIVVQGIGIPNPPSLPGDSSLYAKLGVLAPGKSESYLVQFSQPGQSVNALADPSVATGINATVANVFQGIIDGLSARYPVLGAFELTIEDIGQVLQAFSEMPHLTAALKDFGRQVCVGTFCVGVPDFLDGFRELAAFATSSTEPQILLGLLEQIGTDLAEVVGLTALKTIGAVESVVLEVVTNTLTAFSGQAAGSVSLTAQ
jgi:hypothetical protein